jgi:hypothetical protein
MTLVESFTQCNAEEVHAQHSVTAKHIVTCDKHDMCESAAAMLQCLALLSAQNADNAVVKLSCV